MSFLDLMTYIFVENPVEDNYVKYVIHNRIEMLPCCGCTGKRFSV